MGIARPQGNWRSALKGGTSIQDLGEIRLLEEVFLPDVEIDTSIGVDDCAHIPPTSGGLLWSMDPCPTPVAMLLGHSDPAIFGWYTAAINLSDIAACGGRPQSMLVSLELPPDTTIEFTRSFQRGLMAALRPHGVSLLGGNLKASPRFGATGTIIGAAGTRTVSRKLRSNESCLVCCIGRPGLFWTSVAHHLIGFPLSDRLRCDLNTALLWPSAQVRAGIELARLPFDIACMDASDGIPNALHQLARLNSLDILLLEFPEWKLESEIVKIHRDNSIRTENVCYSFGDWSLVCLVPESGWSHFRSQFDSFSLTLLGTAAEGHGEVVVQDGRTLRHRALNQNFAGGYNSVQSVDELVERFLREPIFA
jgi:thiamine-monophosphate kinase